MISAAAPESFLCPSPACPPTILCIVAVLFWIDVSLIQPIPHLQLFGAVQCLQHYLSLVHRPSTTWPRLTSLVLVITSNFLPPTSSPTPVNCKPSAILNYLQLSAHTVFILSPSLSLCIYYTLIQLLHLTNSICLSWVNLDISFSAVSCDSPSPQLLILEACHMLPSHPNTHCTIAAFLLHGTVGMDGR